MNNEKDNLGDDLKNKASEAFDAAKEKTEDFAEDAKESFQEFTVEAKQTYQEMNGENKKILAGILALLFGFFGVHKFILGYTKEGIIQIIISFVTCGVASIIPFIEGIIYLTKTDEEFYQMYQVNKKPWF